MADSETPNLDALLVLTEQTQPHAKQKGLPTVLVKKQKQLSKKQLEKAFLEGVWDRDKRRSRASGRPLVRSGVADYDHIGEVHHVLKRSTNPEGKWEISRGILLSKTEHVLAETRCPQAPEHMLLEIHGDDDLGKVQIFTWRDMDGKVTKTRHG